jgi:hypothetical protein
LFFFGWQSCALLLCRVCTAIKKRKEKEQQALRLGVKCSDCRIHHTCRECVQKGGSAAQTCSLCRAARSKKQGRKAAPLIIFFLFLGHQRRVYAVDPRVKEAHSTKTNCVIEIVQDIVRREPLAKIVAVDDSGENLDLVENALRFARRPGNDAIWAEVKKRQDSNKDKDSSKDSNKGDSTGTHRKLTEAQRKRIYIDYLRLEGSVRGRCASGEMVQFFWVDGFFFCVSLHSAKRSELLRKFAEDPLINVLLMTAKTGGVGFNITCATYVILLRSGWNPAVERQAIDRVHRIGQVGSTAVWQPNTLCVVLGFVSPDATRQGYSPRDRHQVPGSSLWRQQ